MGLLSTVDKQDCRLVGDTCYISSSARVDALMTGADRFYHKNVGSIAKHAGSDTDGMGGHFIAVEVPLDSHRSITLSHIAVQLNTFARMNRAVKIKRCYYWQHWTQTFC